MNVYEAILRGLPMLRAHEWDDTKLHISDLGVMVDGCPRQLWLRLHRAEKRENHIGEILMFDTGQRIHDRMVEALRLGLEGWRVVDAEKPVEWQGLTGRYDVKLESDDGKVVICDFKTMRGAAFGYLVEPKPSHVAQVLGYVAAENADSAAIIYVDREGQNGIRVFDIDRNDAEVLRLKEGLKAISESSEPPPILKPILERVERKQFDTIYVKQPWNCDYCRYQDISCDGALPPELREKQIAGRIKAGVYEPENDKYTEVVKELLDVSVA